MYMLKICRRLQIEMKTDHVILNIESLCAQFSSRYIFYRMHWLLFGHQSRLWSAYPLYHIQFNCCMLCRIECAHSHLMIIMDGLALNEYICYTSLHCTLDETICDWKTCLYKNNNYHKDITLSYTSSASTVIEVLLVFELRLLHKKYS